MGLLDNESMRRAVDQYASDWARGRESYFPTKSVAVPPFPLPLGSVPEIGRIQLPSIESVTRQTPLPLPTAFRSPPPPSAGLMHNIALTRAGVP